MNSKSFAFLALLATLTTTLSAWADVTIPVAGETVTLQKDETYDANGASVTVAGKIDLNGHNLTMKNIQGLEGSGEITTKSYGELHLDVTKNFEAKTVVLSGMVCLVKEGSSTTLTMGYDSTSYAGGTIIADGTLMIGTKKSTVASNPLLGATGSIITVNEQGIFDVNGKYGFKDVYDIVLNGGTLTTTGARTNISKYPFNPKITLKANSTFKTSNEFNFAGTLELGGFALTIEPSDVLHWGPSSVAAGTIILTGTEALQLEGNGDLSEVSFQVGGTLTLQACNLTVKEYVGNGGLVAGTGMLNVLERFTPDSDTFYPCTMMNGSTIVIPTTGELPWSTTNSEGQSIKFDAGATVTIDVGTRTFKAGDKIVEWPDGTEYSGRTFKFMVNGAVSEEYELQVSATGLTVASLGAMVPTATWTGEVDADATKPGNWSWEIESEPTDDMLPNGTTAVVIPWNKLANLNWPETNALSFATVEFSDEKPTEIVVLEGDRDWRGLGAMDIPFELDLKGHKLYILLPDAESTVETTVTSSVQGGELHVSVAAGKTYNNTSVALTGNLTLIKEGQGTFVQTLTAQSYSGETLVAEGVLATAGGDMSAEGVSLFGTVKSVKVAAGGALDPRGSYNWSDYTIILDGGMISNTVANIGTNNDNKQYNITSVNVNRRFDPNITLLKDSTFATTKTYTFFATVDSNGHELQNWIATSAEVRWQPKTKTGGEPLTMDITGGGKLFILKNCSLNQPTMTLKMTDGWVTMGGDMVVSNYVAASAMNDFDYKNTNALMKVSGKFTPVTQWFIGCTLENGTTLDLSEQTETWTSKGYSDHGDVDFDANATVTIEVGDREFKGTEQIVKWSEGSKASAAKATFVLSAAAKAKGYSLSYDENGLYVGRWGMMLLLR